VTTPIFSQAAVYWLQKLASAVYHQEGVRHRLSDSASLLALLRHCEASREADTIRCYREFLAILTDEQARDLAREGLQLKPSIDYSTQSQRAS